MQSTSDAEAGHILTHLSSGSHASPYATSSNQLTPSSSAAGPSPTSSQNVQTPVNQDRNQTTSTVKRSRQRPTKSCEECRRKKLKCDRELPCANCKKGGRDGSTCYFKDTPGDVRAEKRARVDGDGGLEERERRPYGGVQNYGREGDERVDKSYYSNVPTLARIDPIGPGRGILAYGMNGMSGVDVNAIRARQPQDHEIRLRTSNAENVDRYPDVPAIAREENIGFGRGMFTYGVNDVSTEARNDLPTPVSSTGLAQSDVGARALGRVHVKGSRSRYVGIGDRTAMLDHFDDSKGFILRSFKDPEMSGLIHELAAYQNAFQPKNKPRHVIPQNHELMVEMMKALPSGFLFGILQARYIQNWETIWRVLHIGTFMKDCDQVSKIIESGSFALPPQIQDWVVPQILAIISTASRLNDTNERGSTTERISDDQISKNCLMVKAWVDSLHGKALVNLPTLQTRTLLLLARQASLATPPELWAESGALVRNAMIMGLHQDPEPWEFSNFDKEARRKLWLTIAELDLQFSLAAGVPSSVSSNMFNTRELLNVDDQDLTPEMTEYPTSKPGTTYTDALAQLALSASFPLRLQITNLLGGNLNLATSAPHLLSLASSLEKYLSALPAPFRSSTRAGNTSNKRLHRLFTSIQLELCIRRPLLALYRSIAMSSPEISSKYPEARKGALRNALAILGNLDALDPAVADLSVVKGREYLNLFHVLHRNSILQSALILCFEIKQYNTTSSQSSSEAEGDDGWLQSRVSLTRVVENTLKSLLERIGEFGSDLKDILPLCVALSAVRCDGNGNERRGMMKRGAERVRDACRVARPDVLIKFRNEGGGGVGGSGKGKGVEKEYNRDLLPPPLNSVAWSGNGEIREPQGEALDPAGVGYGDFDMIPDLGFENMDFGFFDWGTNQSWL